MDIAYTHFLNRPDAYQSSGGYTPYQLIRLIECVDSFDYFITLSVRQHAQRLHAKV